MNNGHGRPTFSLVGYGRIAKRHEAAIQAIGGEVVSISDPEAGHFDPWYKGEYVVICTPSDRHADYCRLALDHQKKVICEKPLHLPWQHVPDDDAINVVLQYRYANLPPLEHVRVRMVRPPEYFKGWHGDERQTGGLWYHLLIHYVDLAIQHKCRLTCEIASEGEQCRMIACSKETAALGVGQIAPLELTELHYQNMYRAILADRGVHPRDVRYLHHVLDRLGARYGTGGELLNRPIELDFRDGCREAA